MAACVASPSSWTSSLPYAPHHRYTQTPLRPSSATWNTKLSLDLSPRQMPVYTSNAPSRSYVPAKPRLRLPILATTTSSEQHLPSRRFDPFADEPPVASTSALPVPQSQNTPPRGRPLTPLCVSTPSSSTSGSASPIAQAPLCPRAAPPRPSDPLRSLRLALQLPRAPFALPLLLPVPRLRPLPRPLPNPPLSSPPPRTETPTVRGAPTPFHARHYPTSDARARLLARTLLNRIHAVGRPRSLPSSCSSAYSKGGRTSNGYESECGGRGYTPSRLSDKRNLLSLSLHSWFDPPQLDRPWANPAFLPSPLPTSRQGKISASVRNIGVDIGPRCCALLYEPRDSDESAPTIDFRVLDDDRSTAVHSSTRTLEINEPRAQGRNHDRQVVAIFQEITVFGDNGDSTCQWAPRIGLGSAQDNLNLDPVINRLNSTRGSTRNGAVRFSAVVGYKSETRRSWGATCERNSVNTSILTDIAAGILTLYFGRIFISERLANVCALGCAQWPVHLPRIYIRCIWLDLDAARQLFMAHIMAKSLQQAFAGKTSGTVSTPRDEDPRDRGASNLIQSKNNRWATRPIQWTRSSIWIYYAVFRLVAIDRSATFRGIKVVRRDSRPPAYSLDKYFAWSRRPDDVDRRDAAHSVLRVGATPQRGI
ncbi:hypothetical protein B0H19DRAFT_1067248 [Mycena capillaripes]|nr:hypothetical protein B0H19DRAFT_1067248 [Mycena capillaripes]